MCGEERETIEQMVKECVEFKEREQEQVTLLKDDGRGLEWLKEVKKCRGMGRISEKIRRYESISDKH